MESPSGEVHPAGAMQSVDPDCPAGPFGRPIRTAGDLRKLYPMPADYVVALQSETMDDGERVFIARSTLVMVGTSDNAGRVDVSPRGGPAGFVKTLDDRHLVIPDFKGNNRLDSLSNIIEQPGVSLMFIVPGTGLTLRIAGAACITTSREVLSMFDSGSSPVTAAIGVEVTEVFPHCPKAFVRGGVWRPDRWNQEPGTADLLPRSARPTAATRLRRLARKLSPLDANRDVDPS